MRLTAIRIFVNDIPAARGFYSEVLGFKVIWDHEDSAFGIDAGVTLIIEAIDEGADAEDLALVGRFVGCSLSVGDIDGEYTKLISNGVKFTGQPERQYWGGKLAHFKDPSGNILTLLEE